MPRIWSVSTLLWGWRLFFVDLIFPKDTKKGNWLSLWEEKMKRNLWPLFFFLNALLQVLEKCVQQIKTARCLDNSPLGPAGRRQLVIRVGGKKHTLKNEELAQRGTGKHPVWGRLRMDHKLCGWKGITGVRFRRCQGLIKDLLLSAEANVQLESQLTL